MINCNCIQIFPTLGINLSIYCFPQKRVSHMRPIINWQTKWFRPLQSQYSVAPKTRLSQTYLNSLKNILFLSFLDEQQLWTLIGCMMKRQRMMEIISWDIQQLQLKKGSYFISFFPLQFVNCIFCLTQNTFEMTGKSSSKILVSAKIIKLVFC